MTARNHPASGSEEEEEGRADLFEVTFFHSVAASTGLLWEVEGGFVPISSSSNTVLST